MHTPPNEIHHDSAPLHLKPPPDHPTFFTRKKLLSLFAFCASLPARVFSFLLLPFLAPPSLPKNRTRTLRVTSLEARLHCVLVWLCSEEQGAVECGWQVPVRSSSSDAVSAVSSSSSHLRTVGATTTVQEEKGVAPLLSSLYYLRFCLGVHTPRYCR